MTKLSSSLTSHVMDKIIVWAYEHAEVVEVGDNTLALDVIEQLVDRVLSYGVP